MSTFFKEHIHTIILFGILILLNVIGSYVFTRFDLTEEKRYSISEPTKDFLKNLDDVVTVRVYLTGNLPSGMKELEKSIETTLNEFKAYGGTNLEYDFVDLTKLDKDAQQKEGQKLYEAGIQPINLTVVEAGEQTQKLIYPGATLFYKGRVLSTNLLENKVGYDQYQILNNSIVLIEYKLANAIQKLQQTHPPVVAFSNGHGEVPQAELGEVITELQANQFAVSTIDLKLGFQIDKLVDVLVFTKPTKPFNEKEKYKIDQYLMRGGKILWMMDQMAVEMDSLDGKDFFMAYPRDINLDDLFFKYGVRINDDLILDLQNTKLEIQTGINNNQPQLQYFNWPFFNLMLGNEKHPTSKNLAPFSAQFSSTIDTIKNNNIQKDILLTTSSTSKALLAPVRVFVGMVSEDPDPAVFKQPNLTTAVSLSGKFESLFKTRALSGAYAAITDTIEGLKYLSTSLPGSKMIVISDGDFITNQKKKGKQLPVGYGIYGNNNDPMVFDNKPFFLNCIEFLIDDNNLIETRNKVVKLRQLDATKVKEAKQMIQFNNLISPLIILGFFALIYGFIRRRKYAQ